MITLTAILFVSSYLILAWNTSLEDAYEMWFFVHLLALPIAIGLTWDLQGSPLSEGSVIPDLSFFDSSFFVLLAFSGLGVLAIIIAVARIQEANDDYYGGGGCSVGRSFSGCAVVIGFIASVLGIISFYLDYF